MVFAGGHFCRRGMEAKSSTPSEKEKKTFRSPLKQKKHECREKMLALKYLEL